MCSNSLRGDSPTNAVGLLKREMETFGSLIVAAARAAAVPAGSALAVDRDRFAARVTAALEGDPAMPAGLTLVPIELREGRWPR